jgi:hypothetical protein
MKPTNTTTPVAVKRTTRRIPAFVEPFPDQPFLISRVKQLDIPTGIIGLCAGYERGAWRTKQLAEHMFESLPEFALKYSEYESVARKNPARVMKAAAKAIYSTQKFQNRGEFGELLLHIAIKQEFGAIPAVSKIYYKDSVNDTVKGFDAVHVIAGPKHLELWLGEAKLFDDISSAISAVVDELKKHNDDNYLRREFAAITNKIDDHWPHAKKLRQLLDPNVSLDAIFDSVCIPVLLTYDSKTVNSHTKVSAEYEAAFAAEIGQHFKTFKSKSLPKVRIQLFLVPLKSKKELVAALDERLRIWQQL